MNVVLRAARHGDEAGIWNVHTRAISQVSAKDYSREVISELLMPEPMRNVEAIKDDVVVAHCGDEIVGFGMLNQDGGEIRVLMVDPAYMRRGIGAKLMSQLESLARNAGLTKLIVGSSKYALSFYRACGFTGNDVRIVKGWRTGVEFQEYVLEKQL